MDLTREQLQRLLDLVNSGKPRNWHWLADWITGRYTGNLKERPSTPEWVLEYYENDTIWREWRERST